MSNPPLPTERPIRLAIVGFGRLAQNYYVPALRRLSHLARVIAVADPVDACRSAASTLIPDAKLYRSQASLLESEKLDGILIASPPSAHLEGLREAMSQTELSVFLEKPLVPPGQLASLEFLPHDLRSRVMVNFNRRFWPRYQQIAKIVQSGQLGAIQSAEFELQVDVSKWLAITQHRVESGQGGALYDLGSQMIDLASVTFAKRPISIRAETETRRWEADHVLLALAFSNLASPVHCRVAYDDTTRERIVIAGDKGTLRIDNPNMALHISRGTDSSPPLLGRLKDFATLAGHAARRHTSMSRFTIECAISEFIRTIRFQDRFKVGFDDALFNATALEAAMRSIDSKMSETISLVGTEALA